MDSELTDWAVVAKIGCLLATSYVSYIIFSIVHPPLNFPRNIPTIPFYVLFLGSYTNMDQGEIYERYLRSHLESHGAVKIYFALRWNILVTRPAFLLEIFKDEEVYAKSGNQHKIPYSVLAEYTGDNVISAHGKDWKLYREIVAKPIQFAQVDSIESNAKKMVDAIQTKIGDSDSTTFCVTDLLQKFTLKNVGESIMGIDFGSLNGGTNIVHERVKFVKKQIFNPFYMNFPIFDKFPIPLRRHARQVVCEFRSFLSHMTKEAGMSSNGVSASSRLVGALTCGNITEKQFVDNALILMVAGHENPLLLLLSILYVLAKNSKWQEMVHTECYQIPHGDRPILNSVMYETLRLYPPLGQIINRRTTCNVVLGQSIMIPQGTYVGYNNYGTGRDRTVWGASADNFDPTRWGETHEQIERQFSAAKRNATLPAFHGRKRACLGERFALHEIKIALALIVGKFYITLDDKWQEKITSAGPICPSMLSLKFRRREYNS